MAAVAREEAARAARAAGGRNRASDVLSGKNSKRFLSVGVKKVILEELSAGRSQHELAIEYNVGLRTLRRIKKNRAQIEAAVNDASTRTANKHLSRPVLESTCQLGLPRAQQENKSFSDAECTSSGGEEACCDVARRATTRTRGV